MTDSHALPLALFQLDVPPPEVVAQVGEQPAWFIAALNLQPDDYTIVRPHLGETLPDLDQISGAILSGSWAMVTDRPEWSERTAAWIRDAVGASLPLLGICYGHQLMAHALGGEVGDNPHGWEGGLKTVTQNVHDDPWLAQLPTTFPAWLSHRQSVLIPPSHARVLAHSAQESCQIIRYTPQAMSLQFHPEFTHAIACACQSDNRAQPAAMPGKDWPHELLQRFWQQTRAHANQGR